MATNNATPKPQKAKKGIFDSIKTKLILVMLAAASIPLLIVMIVNYKTSTNKALADAESTLEAQAKYISSEYSGVLQENVDIVRSIAENPTTIVYMEGTAGIEDDVMIQMMQAGDKILNDGSVMAIADASGMQIVRSSGNCVDVKEREYFQEAMKGNIFLSNVLVSKSTGLRQITIAVPIFGSDGKVLGEVQRNYDLEAVHELLASVTDDAFVCDREGTMAAHAQFSIGPEDEYNMAGAPYLANEQGTFIDKTSFDKPLIMTYYRDPLTGYTVVVSDDYNTTMSSARKAATIGVLIGIIMLIAAAAVSVLMAISFTNPVKAVNDSLSKLADGRFATIDKFTGRKDEFGEMVKNTNSVIGKLDGIVANIKASASTVESSSNELSDMANQISQTAEDVSNAVQGIATGATEQAEDIQVAVENVGYIGEAVINVKDSSAQLEELAGKMQKASEASSNSLSNLQVSSNQMTDKIDEISNTISATQDAVTSINEKVEGITSIATQTNLLSLNASIEAARAGEAGRGFAVVAEEIGKLADDSKNMADEIRREMDVLLAQSKAAVAAAEEIKESNLSQQEALGETLDSVNNMLGDIADTVSGVNTIVQGAETCETSKNAVVDTMNALSAISEENAASSEETGASMEELSATVITLAGSANNLKDVSEKLNHDMSFFK
ncbi:MAG: methyl-accepting chemotaxis protein [Lachnospiraceae bacterium]|nr:methyl-accepting chemotaxis protein [Lachnospiraceae bacterium]